MTERASAAPVSQLRARAKVLTPCPEVADASSLLARAIAARSSHRAVAARLGVSHGLVAQWCNPLSDKLPSGRGRALLMHRCPEVAAELARLELEAIEAMKIGVAGHPPRPELLALSVAAAGGEVASELRDAVADGAIDRDEALRIRKASAKARAAHAALERSLP